VIDERLISERFRALAPELNERAGRIWAASEARVLGPGGVAAVARSGGIFENTIRKGIGEIDAGERLEDGRVRRRGGGRKPIGENDPELIVALERLAAEDCRGRTSAASATPPPARCRSPPTAAKRTAPPPALENRAATPCQPDWPDRPRLPHRPAPRNGTKSSTGSSATSARTGAGGR